jgi:CubicO group peptidase (beta-lactamase class C family)
MTTPIDRRQFTAGLLTAIAIRPSKLLAVSARNASPAINPPSEQFLAALPQVMDVAGVPAVGMAVVQDGRVSWTRYVGVADVTSKQPVNPETIWPAASLSKPLFAFAALHLVDEGKLDLDKPLKSYVPDHTPDDARGNRITARHVLSHSSGLRNWRNRLDQPLVPDFEPGARFQYSGEGFFYLQRTVEHIAQMSFEDFMQTRILKPLGMSSSTYLWRGDIAGRLATGHNQGQPATNFSKDFAPRLLDAAAKMNKPLASFTYEDMVALMGTITPAPTALPNNMLPNSAGSLLTTPTDYGAFLVELIERHNASVDLAPATRALMRTKQTPINDVLGWALGIGMERQGNEDFLWHWGDNGAWKNFLLVHPASRSAIVIFTNGSKGLNVANRIVTASTGAEHPAFLWL